MRAVFLVCALVLTGCGRRTLDLPASAPLLQKEIVESRDAAELSRRLSGMGITRIRVGSESAPESRWTPETGDRLVMFWRIYTGHPVTRADGSREYALIKSPQGSPRVLALDEPPLLQTLAVPGDALARSGKWREAGRAWETARRQCPSLPVLHARLGDCHTATGNYAKAFSSYSRAISMGGPNPEIFSRMGEMFEKSRRPRDAEEAFEKSAGLDPDNPARWTRLARAQASHGKRAPAVISLDRALALDPRNAPALELKSTLGRKR